MNNSEIMGELGKTKFLKVAKVIKELASCPNREDDDERGGKA